PLIQMWIGISLGDVTGIGPEVTLKALAAEASSGDTHFLLIGDEGQVRRINQQLGLNLPIEPYSGRQTSARICLPTPRTAPLSDDLVGGSPAAARAAVAWLRDGAERCLRGELNALVTAPVNKEAIIRSGQPFIGQTEFLSQLAGTQRTAMMLLGHDDRGRWLRVALATNHVPLKDVSEKISAEKVELVIELATQACRDLGLPRARVAVCGLNPHAGEGGKIGDEEQTKVTPAVLAAQRREFDGGGAVRARGRFFFVVKSEYVAVGAMLPDPGFLAV